MIGSHGDFSILASLVEVCPPPAAAAASPRAPPLGRLSKRVPQFPRRPTHPPLPLPLPPSPQKAGLADKLGKDFSGTVLAPTNAAFAVRRLPLESKPAP